MKKSEAKKPVLDKSTIITSMTYDAIWAFSEDIMELKKKFKEELIAHTSQPFGIPLHRYKGQLILDEKSIQLIGKSKDSREDFQLSVSLKETTDIYLGWDGVLQKWRDTRAQTKPLRLTFEDHQKSKTLYIYAKSQGIRPYGNENKELFKVLSSKLKKVGLSDSK